jgi:hypothetical protein
MERLDALLAEGQVFSDMPALADREAFLYKILALGTLVFVNHSKGTFMAVLVEDFLCARLLNWPSQMLMHLLVRHRAFLKLMVSISLNLQVSTLCLVISPFGTDFELNFPGIIWNAFHFLRFLIVLFWPRTCHCSETLSALVVFILSIW